MRLRKLLLVLTVFLSVLLVLSASPRSFFEPGILLVKSGTVWGFQWPDTYPVINVSDYSGENDSVRIQTALNDAALIGAVVLIPGGVWEASNLTAQSRTIILGMQDTVLRRPANDTSPFLVFEDQTDFAVMNVTFDGLQVSGASGIHLVNCSRFEISGNVFENIDVNAVRVDGLAEDFSISGNLLNVTNVAPIIVFGSPGIREVRRFEISNNTLLDSTNNGKIAVAFAADGVVSGNYLLGNNFGVATRCVTNITIVNNWIENCTSYGIYLGSQPGDEGSFDVNITGNYVLNSEIGIARYYGSGVMDDISLTDNTIVDSRLSDVQADFQASFVNNTFTSREKVQLLVPPKEFYGNLDVNGTFIIPADINGDGRVDMRDLGLASRLYGLTVDSEYWNPSADVIQDGVIDMRDIGFVARFFGIGS